MKYNINYYDYSKLNDEDKYVVDELENAIESIDDLIVDYELQDADSSMIERITNEQRIIALQEAIGSLNTYINNFIINAIESYEENDSKLSNPLIRFFEEEEENL